MKANTLKQRENAYKELFKDWDANLHLITLSSSCSTMATSILKFFNSPNDATLDSIAQSMADFEIMQELTNQRYDGQELAKKVELYKKQKVRTLIDRRLLEIKKGKAEEISELVKKADEEGDKSKSRFLRSKIYSLFGNRSTHKTKKAKVIKDDSESKTDPESE